MYSPRPRRVSAIVLAAGENRRLQGVIPPFFKPLLVVNGRALITHAIDHVRDTWEVDEVVIVASPRNIEPIIEVIDINVVRFIIQPSPTSVVDAWKLGFSAIDPMNSDVTVIVCADNLFDYEGALFPSEYIHDAAVNGKCFVATRRLEATQGNRFTVIDNGVPQEPPYLMASKCVDCWIGPVLVPTGTARELIQRSTAATIEGLLRDISTSWNKIPMTCSDIGVPDALPRNGV